MRSAPRVAHAFMLLELLLVCVAIMAMAELLAVMMVDGLYIERAARDRADRLAAVAMLTRQMRSDVLAADSGRWDGAALTLETAGPDGRRRVRYAVGRDAVTRLAAGAETHLWRAARLEFAARLEPGPHADLLMLDCITQPAPRAGERTPRISSLPLVLPRHDALGRVAGPGTPAGTTASGTPAQGGPP